MDDLISRQALVDWVAWYCDDPAYQGYVKKEHLIDMLKTAPSAQSERKTGRWIPVTKTYEVKEEEFPEMRVKWVDAVEPDEEDAVRCSECKTVFDFESARNWCSQCGARMKGGDAT